MNQHITVKLAGIALVLAVAAGCTTTPNQSASTAPPVEWDGLQQVKINGLDTVYVKPGASLAGYTKIMVDPLQVSFKKGPDANGGWRPNAFPINERDREKIRNSLAGIASRQLAVEMQKGGYQIVNAPAPDVLRVTAAIIKLDITAPDTMTGRSSYVVVASKGSMTLVAELRDSQTGDLLARAVDYARDDSSFRYEVANSFTNAQAARTIIGQWAHILRQRLDAARAADQPEAKN